MDPLSHDELEKRLHRTLRELPLHRAPDTLEDRVLTILSARAALPWWRRSYVHWPKAARTGFFVGSAAAAAVVIIASVAGVQGAAGLLEAPVADVRDHVEQARVAGSVVAGVGRSWLPIVSSLWWYGAAGAVVAAYMALLGLGAAFYRLLLRHV